jgi:hypothetical protein
VSCILLGYTFAVMQFAQYGLPGKRTNEPSASAGYRNGNVPGAENEAARPKLILKEMELAKATSRFMNQFKLICLTMISRFKRIWLLPQTLRSALQQRREQVLRDVSETERLDRIRNPSKYLGR